MFFGGVGALWTSRLPLDSPAAAWHEPHSGGERLVEGRVKIFEVAPRTGLAAKLFPRRLLSIMQWFCNGFCVIFFCQASRGLYFFLPMAKKACFPNGFP